MFRGKPRASFALSAHSSLCETFLACAELFPCSWRLFASPSVLLTMVSPERWPDRWSRPGPSSPHCMRHRAFSRMPSRSECHECHVAWAHKTCPHAANRGAAFAEHGPQIRGLLSSSSYGRADPKFKEHALRGPGSVGFDFHFGEAAWPSLRGPLRRVACCLAPTIASAQDKAENEFSAANALLHCVARCSARGS